MEPRPNRVLAVGFEISHDCPFCGKMVRSGEGHWCRGRLQDYDRRYMDQMKKALLEPPITGSWTITGIPRVEALRKEDV